MARRRGLIATLAQIQREAARAEAARRRAESASRRQAEQARLRYTRAVAADEREREVQWTLNLQGMPIYVIRPTGAFAAAAYELLRRFLREEVTDGACSAFGVSGMYGQ